MIRLYVLWAWLFVALGLTFSIFGPALPEMRAEFGLPLAAAGLAFATQSAGYLGVVLLAGGLSDTRGRKFVCGAGAAALAAAMAGAAAAPSWWLVLALMVVASGGFGLVDVGLNAAIGDATPGAGRRAAALNLLHSAFAAGTLAAPAGLALVLRLGYGWRAMFMVTAVGAAVSLVGFWPGSARWPRAQRAAAAGASRDGESITAQAPPLERGQNSRFKVQRRGGGWFRHRFGRATASGAPDGSGGASTGGAAGGPGAFSGPVRLRRLLREPYLRNLAAFQGLYVGVEAALAGWLATYLVEQFGATPAAAALATSLYWGGFLVGRPATAVIAHRYGPQRVLPWLCPLGAAAAAAGVVAPSAAWATAAYAAAGLAISGIFPTVMALALEGRTHDAGATAALIAGAAAVGGLIWPWLVGVLAQEAGLRIAMAVAAAPLVAMLALAWQVGHPPSPARPTLVPKATVDRA